MTDPTRAAAQEIGRLGDRVLDAIDRLGQFTQLAGQTARSALHPRFPWLEVLRQVEAIGARSSTIVLITALFTGMVLALQTASRWRASARSRTSARSSGCRSRASSARC